MVSYGVIKNHDSINPAYILYFSIPFLLYLYIKNIIKTKRELDIYDYIFYFLIFTGLLTSFFAINTEISFLGKDYRHEGFLSLLSYYLLFITWKDKATKDDIKKIINIFVFIGIFNSLYSILQVYTKLPFILRYTREPMMASGICGNPNFFGSLVVTLLGIITTKFLINKMNIKCILLLILFFISLINVQSTGPFLTYIITVIFLIIYLKIKNKIILKNIVYLIIILVLTYLFIFILNNKVYKLGKCEMCDFMGVVSNAEQNSDYRITNGRIEIWKDSLKLVKKRPFIGVGYDNYHLSYYDNVNLSAVVFTTVNGEIKAQKKYPEIIDNAHNVYLHTLVTSGIFGLLPYLLLCLYTFIRGLKTKDINVMLLFGGFVAYSIQAFGNISVIQVAPVYFIIIGLILSINELQKETSYI